MFDFDAVIHEVTHEPYEFMAAGERWRLPHVNELTIGQKRAADMGLYEMLMRDVGERFDEDSGEWVAAGDDGAGVFIDKHDDQIGAFRAAWLAHAGMKPGESRASSR